MEVSEVEFRFYGELNEFLAVERRGRSLRVSCNGRVSAKHQIEALGVPHTEVTLLLANGVSVGFDHVLVDGDRLAVYPHFSTLALEGMVPLRPPLPKPVRFLLDVHLGQLATYLRLLGFDAGYDNEADDTLLAGLAGEENRVLVTRDRGLLMRKSVTHGCCLRSRDPWEQLMHLLARYDLWEQVCPWRRCLRCNGTLESVPKTTILHRLEPKTRRYYNEFKECQSCGQIYWQGSHFSDLVEIVSRVLASRPDGEAARPV